MGERCSSKKKPKTPLFDRLKGTTFENVASYVEAHKGRQEGLVESTIVLLAMSCAGHFLTSKLPSTLNKANRDVLAFEVFVFSLHLLRHNFDSLESRWEVSEAADDAWGSVYAMCRAAIVRETSWEIAGLFEQRLMQYASTMTARKAVEKFLPMALSIGTAAHPNDRYGVLPLELVAQIELTLSVTSFATTIPKAAAETLQNIITEYRIEC